MSITVGFISEAFFYPNVSRYSESRQHAIIIDVKIICRGLIKLANPAVTALSWATAPLLLLGNPMINLKNIKIIGVVYISQNHSFLLLLSN